MRKSYSLKYQMLRLLMAGWYIPLIVLIMVLMVSVSGRVNRQLRQSMTTSMEKASEICAMRLEDCILASKDASYLPTIRDAWETYQSGGNAEQLYADVTLFLQQLYKFDNNFNMTVLYFTDEPERFYYTGSDKGTGALGRLGYYRDNAHEKVQELSRTLDTKTQLISAGERAYLVRNIMGRDFKPYAVLVMELNNDSVFGSLASVWEQKGYSVWCNGELLMSVGDEAFPYEAAYDTGDGVSLLNNRTSHFAYYSVRDYDNAILYAVSYNRSAVITEQRSIQTLFLIVIILMIPMLYMVFRFFDQRISSPITRLTESSRQIADGIYQIRVPEPEGDGEITELTRNFNRMSEKLGEQFNHILVEEIALRDANIHALQSQINPHFLNNTLEIINWETRLSGNDKAGRMIEALATMMNATMDRTHKPLIPLAEELEYVRAYLYIIECRYGDRFHYEEEVDETLLTAQVPRLIIQPVVENAVEHGAGADGDCRVGMYITREETGSRDICIRVTNNGALTAEDKEKIQHLLHDEELDTAKEHSVGIGIRNVHKRLQIIYGGDSGLSIDEDADGHTVSTIRICVPQAEQT